MVIHITETHSGRTVLNYVRYELGLSRRILVRLKQTGGGINVNGQQVTVRSILQAGDVLELLIEDNNTNTNTNTNKVKEDITPYDYPIEVIYEDDYLIVVNKPPYMPTHQSRGHLDDTLANVISHYFRDTPSFTFTFRPANRLDRDTSGLVLISKDQLTAHKMSLQLKQGIVQKEYRAILCGKINPVAGRIETYIRRVSDSIIKREAASCGIESEYAVTEYKCIASNDNHNYSIVDVSPITGRTHQLRVHFAHLGYPVCGDTLYGIENDLIKRQALHSHKLKFIHPYNRQLMDLEAPVPDDMKKIYEVWFNE